MRFRGATFPDLRRVHIPMYLIGAPHPHKLDARILLGRLVSLRERMVTDAEVFQEAIHRYSAIGRREATDPAFTALLGVVDAVLGRHGATGNLVDPLL